MPLHRVVIEVHDVRGRCAAGYKPGDKIIVEGFYVVSGKSANICTCVFSYDDPIIGISSRGFG